MNEREGQKTVAFFPSARNRRSPGIRLDFFFSGNSERVRDRLVSGVRVGVKGLTWEKIVPLFQSTFFGKFVGSRQKRQLWDTERSLSGQILNPVCHIAIHI